MEIRDKLSSWMKNLDPTSKEINDMLDSEVLQVLEDRDDNHQRVAFFKPSMRYNMQDEIKLFVDCLFSPSDYYNYNHTV